MLRAAVCLRNILTITSVGHLIYENVGGCEASRNKGSLAWFPTFGHLTEAFSAV